MRVTTPPPSPRWWAGRNGRDAELAVLEAARAWHEARAAGAGAAEIVRAVALLQMACEVAWGMPGECQGK